MKDKRYLNILWEDSTESMLALANLRKNCPCATCVSEREKTKGTYIPLLSTIQLTLKDIKVVGNYALQLVWQDNHDSGIFTYESLSSWKTSR